MIALGNRGVLMSHSGHPDAFAERVLRNIGLDHSGLMFAIRITSPHFSVSSAMNLPKPAGVSLNTTPPRLARRPPKVASARPALISLFNLSTMSTGVFLGALTPCQPLAS